MSAPTLLYLGTEADKEYSPYLKQMVGDCSCYTLYTPISTLAEVLLYCQKRNITGVFSTSQKLLSLILGRTHERKQPSLQDYQGSFFSRSGISFVFLSPLEQFHSVNYGQFLARRFISKLAYPEQWPVVPAFKFSVLEPHNVEAVFSRFSSAIAIACDIETFQNPLSIRCIGYTAIYSDSHGNLQTESVVLPLDSEWALAWMRRFNWELKAPKIFQNGKYDIAYLSMYDAVPYNYLWDTATMFHCWYVELPKDLAMLSAFFIREAFYWKDLAQTNDLLEYYRYNALDTWATANVFIAWTTQAPDWAKHNYFLEFPVNFPCHLCELTGIARDMEELQLAASESSARITAWNKELEVLTATPGINSNSHVQVKQLLTILGCKDIAEKSSDEKSLAKASYRHPLNAKILGKVLDIRGERKLASTYLPTGQDGKEFPGSNRILFALNPHGTDTGRLASRESQFWCGLQVQNIPRGKDVKRTLVADPGFMFAECDLEQAETRDTAHIAGEERMIAAVQGSKDFHSLNCSEFFGVPYAEIYDDAAKKTLDKILRDLSKRVNHGANYNMGPGVLVDTMGLENIYKAQAKLKLPKHWSPLEIADYLLSCFHKTYPAIKQNYYPGVIADVENTKLLIGATGWTRYCFGKPSKNKRDLNAYVAHPPQSLNAMTLNQAFMRVFYELAINPIHSSNFKLIAQIHDSILFQFRKGHDYLLAMVKEMMEIPVTVKGYDGKTRTFTVPAAIKAGKDMKGAYRWSETE